MTETKNMARHSSRVPPTIVPDRAIGVFFAAFPIAVAAFLSIQAVRAAGMEDHAASSRPSVTDIAR